MRAGQRKCGPRVTEIGRGPSAGSVAIGTGVAEIRLNMVRVAGRIVRRLMAGVTVGRCARIPRCVTGGAGSIDMFTSQRKSSVCVVEGRRRPAIR